MTDKQAEGTSSLTHKRQLVEYTIDSIAGGGDLPGGLMDMLNEAWSEYMLQTLVKNGENSTEWAFAVSIVNTLVWSVNLGKNVQQGENLFRNIHDLIAGLKQGLESVGYGPCKTSILLIQLREIHLGLLGVKRDSIDHGSYSLPADDKFEGVVKKSKTIQFESHKSVIAKPDAACKVEVGINGERAQKINPSYTALTPAGTIKYKMHLNEPDITRCSGMGMLKEGSWVEFCSGGGQLRCRLPEKTSQGGKILFFNRHGIKVAEKSFSEVEGFLGNGEMKILDDAFLFDRALASVIGDLRNHKKH